MAITRNKDMMNNRVQPVPMRTKNNIGINNVLSSANASENTENDIDVIHNIQSDDKIDDSKNVSDSVNTNITTNANVATDTTNTTSDESFKPYINGINETKDDNNNEIIENEIATIILKATTSVQTKCEKDEHSKMKQIRYFEKKDNSTLLDKVLNNVYELVNKLDINSAEKGIYFNNVINKFIQDRLSFISKVCLDEYYSPSDVEKVMKTFLTTKKDYIDPSVLTNHYNYYSSFCIDMIYSRLGRTTVYMSELLSEALDIKKRETGVDMSSLVNEILLDNIGEEYINRAKQNIHKRKPINNHYTKSNKSKVRNL